MHIPHLTPQDSPLAISYTNHQKNLAYFSHLAPFVLFLFVKRQSQKGGPWHNGPPLNKLLRLGFGQREAQGYLITLIGRTKKKRFLRPQMSCFHRKHR